MKLWKVRIKYYLYSIFYHDEFVLADTESDMLEVVNEHLITEFTLIDSYKEIDLNDTENRVI